MTRRVDAAEVERGPGVRGADSAHQSDQHDADDGGRTEDEGGAHRHSLRQNSMRTSRRIQIQPTTSITDAHPEQHQTEPEESGAK